MSEVKDLASDEMFKLADVVSEIIKEAKELATSAKTTIGSLGEGVEEELKAWVATEQKKLDVLSTRVEIRITKATNIATKFRDDAKRKESDESSELEKRVMTMIKYHKKANKLTNDELFAAFDANKDGKIEEGEFLKFFKTCEKEPATEEDGKTAASKECSAEDFAKFFSYIDDEEEGVLTKEKFGHLVRLFMKVAKDTVITEGLSIKEGKTIRRLEVGEVLEILEGPIEEDSIKIQRMRVKVMKDDLEGWVTLAGNQGTSFLEEGGNIFKVVAETILTEAFALDGSGAKEACKKLRDSTRKLKVGEIVEVREWEKKEAKSGLMRMKCRVQADGVVGWVTTVGNTGTVFLEVA